MRCIGRMARARMGGGAHPAGEWAGEVRGEPLTGHMTCIESVDRPSVRHGVIVRLVKLVPCGHPTRAAIGNGCSDSAAVHSRVEGS